MKEIKLTQGKVTLVDDEDYEYLNQWKWHALKSKGTYYAVRNVYLGGGRKNYKFIGVRMHMLIMQTPKGMVTDHIDHNGLNNQRYNLRIATYAQNRYNSSSRGSSRYLGVYINQTVRYKGKIEARIQINGRRKYLGAFPTEKMRLVLMMS